MRRGCARRGGRRGRRGGSPWWSWVGRARQAPAFVITESIATVAAGPNRSILLGRSGAVKGPASARARPPRALISVSSGPPERALPFASPAPDDPATCSARTRPCGGAPPGETRHPPYVNVEAGLAWPALTCRAWAALQPSFVSAATDARGAPPTGPTPSDLPHKAFSRLFSRRTSHLRHSGA